MIQVGKPYVNQAIYILNFRQPELSVRLEQREAEGAFGGLMAVQSQQLNVPDDADPNVARIMFASGKKSITISQLAVQLALQFDSTMPLSKQLEVIEKNVRDFYARVPHFKNPAAFAWSALVLKVNFPSAASTEEIHGFLYENLVKPSPVGQIASVQASIGFRIGEIFSNVGASVYESRDFSAKVTPNQPRLLVDFGNLPLVEKGVEITADVNTRPRQMANPGAEVNSPDELFAAIRETLEQYVPALTGLKV